MNVPTWILTVTLALGLLLSSTAALCLSPDEQSTAPAESSAHSHGHSHPGAHPHRHDGPMDPTNPADESEAPPSDLCHHHQTPPLLTSMEGPSCDLCQSSTTGSDPLLTVRHLSISTSNAIGPPLYHAPLDRPPALSG